MNIKNVLFALPSERLSARWTRASVRLKAHKQLRLLRAGLVTHQLVEIPEDGLAVLLVRSLDFFEQSEKAFSCSSIVAEPLQINNELQLLGYVRDTFDDLPVNIRQLSPQLK
jgi:hypothetical protein